MSTYRLRGWFVEFRENVPGEFGPETFLDLQTPGGIVRVLCSAALERTLTERRKLLDSGAWICVEFSDEDPVDDTRLPMGTRCRPRAEFSRGER